MRMSRIIPVLAVAIILILPTLFSGGGSVLQKADVATTYDITTDTTWGDKELNSGDVVNIASDVTLTITGTVSGGNFNVHGRLNVYVTGVLNINLGGTLVDSGTVYVNGLLNINSGGTLNVNSGAVNINSGGTLNVGGKVENFYGIQIAKGGVLRINDSGRFHNNGDTGSTVIYGTLNINNDAELDNDGGIKLYNEGILKVFTGGVLNNDGILFKHCSRYVHIESWRIIHGQPNNRQCLHSNKRCLTC